MKKVEYIKISVPRLEAFMHAAERMNDMLKAIQPKGSDTKVDWSVVGRVWTGIIDLSNNLYVLTPTGREVTKQYGDSFLFDDTEWVDNFALLEIEKDN